MIAAPAPSSGTDAQDYRRWKSEWQAEERVATQLINNGVGGRKSEAARACKDALPEWRKAEAVMERAPTQDLRDATGGFYVAVERLILACAKGSQRFGEADEQFKK